MGLRVVALLSIALAMAIGSAQHVAFAKAKKKHGWRFDPGARVGASYDGNFLHVADVRKRNFDAARGAGERFGGLDAAEDLVARVGLDGRWTRRLGKRRDLVLSLGADRFLYQRNDIADYSRFKGGAAFDWTKRDRFSLGLSLVPDAFRKNYKVLGVAPYRPAFYREAGLSLGHRRLWSKHWKSSLRYEFRRREFDDPFDSRDRDRHGLGFLATYHLKKRHGRMLGLGEDVDVKLGLGWADTALDPAVEQGLSIDRSTRDIKARVGLELSLPWAWRTAIDVDWRLRTYTTGARADVVRFRRKDRRWRFGIETRKRLRKGLHLLFSASSARNRSSRVDPSRTDDEIGYSQSVFGFGIEYAF